MNQQCGARIHCKDRAELVQFFRRAEQGDEEALARISHTLFSRFDLSGIRTAESVMGIFAGDASSDGGRVGQQWPF